MAKRIGKYKISNRESALNLTDGGTITGAIDLGGNQIAGSKIEVKTGDVGTLAAGDTGALISLSGGARTLVLPTVATAGLNFKIVAGSAHNHIISCSSGEIGKLQGQMIDASNASTIVSAPITGKTAITLANGKIGDVVSCVSDGTSWHVEAVLNDTATLS
jgi:hypothetical protein